MTAAAVGSTGIIGFLGLVAPHISRRLLGVDWRWSLPGSAILGAGLLLAADIVAQRALPNTELPVGVVTALLGAPFLLVLLRRKDN
jgi:iron complex transport system permease protein